MTLLYIDISTPELLFVILLYIAFVIGIGNYGKATIGYKRSVLIALLFTPIIAFILVSLLKRRSTAN